MAYFLNREKDYPASLNKDGASGMEASYQSQGSRVCGSQFPKTRSPSTNNHNLQSTRMVLVLFLALEKEAGPMTTSYDAGFGERDESTPFRVCLEAWKQLSHISCWSKWGKPTYTLTAARLLEPESRQKTDWIPFLVLYSKGLNNSQAMKWQPCHLPLPVSKKKPKPSSQCSARGSQPPQAPSPPHTWSLILLWSVCRQTPACLRWWHLLS